MSGEHIIRNETYIVSMVNAPLVRTIKEWSPARAAQEWARREDDLYPRGRIARGDSSVELIVNGPNDFEARYRVTGRLQPVYESTRLDDDK